MFFTAICSPYRNNFWENMHSLVAKDSGLLNTVSNDSKICQEGLTLVALCRWPLIQVVIWTGCLTVSNCCNINFVCSLIYLSIYVVLD